MCKYLGHLLGLYILRQNVNSIDQNQTDTISVTFSDISEMYMFYGKSSVCRKQMEEDDFVVKNYVLNDLEQKEQDNALPV